MVKQQEALSKKQTELATAYGKVLASGGDVTQTDWYKLIETVNKKKGTDLNPYDEAKRLGITLPKGLQKPKKSLFDTAPIKGKADLTKSTVTIKAPKLKGLEALSGDDWRKAKVGGED